MICVTVVKLKRLLIISSNVPLYTILRNGLKLEADFVPMLTLNIILNGEATLSEQSNLELHTALSENILKTYRF